MGYLGRKFVFDNIATPLNLQSYPYEVSREIIENTDKNIKTILDIGGNIGQLAVTLQFFLPKSKIDVFEPNPEIFELLKINCGKKIRTFPYGVGKKGKEKLFFEPNRTATGSLYKENSSDNEKSIREVNISITNRVAEVTGRNMYDLVAIDVEGYEFEVVKNIKDIETRYLYIEVSTHQRAKNYFHSGLFSEIKKQFGEFDICYQASLKDKDILTSYLLKFS